MIVVHDVDMDLDWQRLGQALKATRSTTRDARGAKLTQEQAAVELGVSRSVIQNIERGIGFDKPTPTIREYARRLGWAEGSVDRVLAGEDPVFASESTSSQAAPSPVVAGLPVRIQHELEQGGDLVDTKVIELPGGGSVVIVVKNPPGATPEQRERNLEAWLRTQPALRDLDRPVTESSQDV